VADEPKKPGGGITGIANQSPPSPPRDAIQLGTTEPVVPDEDT
jgi:hypothetical protein